MTCILQAIFFPAEKMAAMRHKAGLWLLKISGLTNWSHKQQVRALKEREQSARIISISP
jgi:hypothetical protein